MNKLMSLLAALFIMVGFANAQTGMMAISGDHLVDSSGTPLASGTITFAPVDGNNNPLSYRIGTLGNSISRPISAQVTNGVFTTNIPDTSVTNPQNVCFAVTVIDNNTGENILGSGYGCVQPSSTASWCTTSICNFDTYVPTLTASAIAYPPSVAIGTTSTSFPGAPAQAINVGDQTGAVINFVIPQGIQGPIGGPTSGVNMTPPATQKVIQPPNTSLLVNSQNNVRYVDPTSTVDLITQINTLFTQCSLVCKVVIPAGNYGAGFTTPVGTDGTNPTVLIHSATQTLEGDGKDKVRITYAGLNFLDWRYSGACASETSTSCYDFNASSTVGGFTITCTNRAAQCLTGGSTIGAHWKNINVYGPTGIVSLGTLTPTLPANTAQGFVFQNTYQWMERWQMEDVNIGGFQIAIHFMAPTGAGTNSYGYGKLSGVWTNQGAASQGVVVDSGANVYNLLGFDYQFNLGGTTAGDGTAIFYILGTFTGEGFHVTGENAGFPYMFAHLSGGLMLFNGDYDIEGPPPANGNIQVDTVTSGGVAISYGPTIPFYIGPQMGARFTTSGIPLLVNYDGSGESFVVNPIYVPDFTTNQVAGRFGYLYSTTTNKNTPYIATDVNSKFAIFTRNEFSTEAALTPRWTVDGSGNTSSVVRFSVTAPTGSVPPQACADFTITGVTGLQTTDTITQIQPSANFGFLSVTAYPSPTAGGNLVVHYCNPTAASVAINAATYKFSAPR